MATSDSGSPPPRPPRSSFSPAEEDRQRISRRSHHSGRGEERESRKRRYSSPDSEDESRRRRRHHSPSYPAQRSAREGSRHRSRDRRRRRERRRSESSHSCDRRRHKDDDRDRERRRERREGRGKDRERERGGETERRSKRRHHSNSESPPPAHSKSPIARPPSPHRRARAPLASQAASFRGNPSTDANDAASLPPEEKQKPNFNSTGLLAKEANTIAGTNTVLKYHEPPESRRPPSNQQWRIYVFKGKETLDTIHLFSRSCWLLGRDDKICDYVIQHPSASKQHAVIQFRYISKTNEFGERQGKVKPYLIDLESANGTKLNGKRVDPSKFVELLDGDVLAFGESEREYVLMLPPPG